MSNANERLAILGGVKAVPDGLLQPWPEITEEDKQAVMAVLDRGILWGQTAPQISALQKEWADWLGMKHCLATNSGTAALHMCVAALGIGPGDEVITTPLSFTATATCVLHHNAIPVFADIEPDSNNINPRMIETKITDRTKAILVVHLYGLPADMDPIMEIAAKHGLAVIEDACQAHGSTYKGRKVGTFGQASAFSLNGNKNLAGGEGGLFVTNDEFLWREAARVQQFGEERRVDGAREYNAYGMGWMYRTSEMPAAFARSQLRRLDRIIAATRENGHRVSEAIKDFKGFRAPVEPDDRLHTFERYTLHLFPEELGINMPADLFTDRIKAALVAEGVAIGRWQFVIPMMTLFQERMGYGKGCPWTCGHYRGKVEYRAEDFPVALDTLARSVAIEGMKPPNGRDLVDTYIKAIGNVYHNLDELVQSNLQVSGPVGGYGVDDTSASVVASRRA